MGESPARIGHERIEEVHHRDGHSLSRHARAAAIVIALLAAVLAIADLSAHRATKTIITAKSDAGALSTQYEALDNHRTTLENDQLLIDALGSGARTPAAAAAQEEAKAAARREAAALEAEEAKVAAKRAALDDKAVKADERYSDLEIGIGALQLGIVLASVSIVAAAAWLLGVGVAFGLVGLGFTVYAIAVV